MQGELYIDMAKLEASHFWFRARRDVLSACLVRHLPETERGLILDAGCGTGSNLSFLNRFGKTVGSDIYQEACRICATTKGAQIAAGRLEALPFQDETFAVVALLDVLEHVDEQQQVLLELVRVLRPGGTLLLTVPAFRHLWGGHDIVHQHRRRYRAKELRGELRRAGLHIAYLSYYNTHLYPLVAASRLLRRQTATPASDMHLPPLWINHLLYWIFRSERHWIGRFSAPFGVSLVAVAKKTISVGQSTSIV